MAREPCKTTSHVLHLTYMSTIALSLYLPRWKSGVVLCAGSFEAAILLADAVLEGAQLRSAQAVTLSALARQCVTLQKQAAAAQPGQTIAANRLERGEYGPRCGWI